MGQCIVKFNIATTTLLKSGSTPDDIQTILDNANLSLEPLDSSDGPLSGYYCVAAPSSSDLREIADKFLHTQGVDGAYVKPDDAPPM